MATQIQRWMPLILIGGVLWFLSRDGSLTRANGGNGGNGVPSNGTQAPGAGGPAVVGGSMGSIAVDPDEYELGLFAHRVQRENGQTVDVTVPWTQTTVDFQGAPINWPVQITVNLGHYTQGFLRNWTTMDELIGSGSGMATETQAQPGSHTTPFSLQMGTETDFPKDWDVEAQLFMQGSTATGNPDGIWQLIEVRRHDDAVRSIRSQGTAVIGGSIGTIGITAGAIGSGGNDDPWGNALYTNRFDIPSATGNMSMKKLGLRAQRPPWGMIGHPDTRFPISNRNMTLPGVEVRVRQNVSATGVGSPIGPGRRVYAV